MPLKLFNKNDSKGDSRRPFDPQDQQERNHKADKFSKCKYLCISTFIYKSMFGDNNVK